MNNQRLHFVKTSLDNILEYGADSYKGTPLLADGIDLTTGKHVEWQYNKETEPMVISNLANQSYLMRAFVALSALTGDAVYKKRVLDIYRYYIDNCRSENGLFYWGGHATFDLKTGSVRKGCPDKDAHELKNHFPYMEPFYEIDKNVFADIIRAVWCAHITDFSEFHLTRHASYINQIDTNTWYKPDVYNESNIGKLIEAHELSFRNVGNDLITMAVTMYRYTGDKYARYWADRMVERFNSMAESDTKIGVFQISLPVMQVDPMKALVPFGAFNTLNPIPDVYTYSNYGDRARNQFAETFVQDGLVSESDKWKINEAYFSTGKLYADCPLVEIALAEEFGHGTDGAKKIITPLAQGMASYGELAYIPGKNQMRPITAFGLDLSGYVFKRGGYYGNIGSSFRSIDADSNYFLQYSRMTQVLTEHYGELSRERDKIWKVARGIANAIGLGDLGEAHPGDRPNLNQQTDCLDPLVIPALIYLYRYTRQDDFLKLAERVADNLSSKHFNGKFFVNPDNKYTRFSPPFMFVLLMLEAEISGEENTIPGFALCRPYFQSDFLQEDGVLKSKTLDCSVLWHDDGRLYYI